MMRTCNLRVTSDQERGGQMAGSGAECRVCPELSPLSLSQDYTSRESASSIENCIDMFKSAATIY